MSVLNIFISHSSKNNAVSNRLATDLRKMLGNDKNVWIDRSGLHGGDKWWTEIQRSLKKCSVCIVILSPDAIASEWVNKEIDIALKRSAFRKPKLLIPLLYQPCKVRNELKELHMINFHSQSYDLAFRELLTALGLSSGLPGVPRKVNNNNVKLPFSSKKTKEQWLDEGRDHYDMRRFAEAVVAYGKAITLDPDYILAYVGRAEAYLALEARDEVISDCEQALTLDSKCILAYYYQGAIHYSRGDYWRAIQPFSKAIELGTDDYRAYYFRGISYLEEKKYKKAVTDLKKALALNPKSEYIKRDLKKAKEKQHDKELKKQRDDEYTQSNQEQPNNNRNGSNVGRLIGAIGSIVLRNLLKP